METNETWEFRHHGPFAACAYDCMIPHLDKCGHGNWKMATTAETLQYSQLWECAITWTSTQNLWTSEGVIVYDDPLRKMPSTQEELMKLYEQGDPSVRFVKYGFKEGEMSVSDFVKNSFIIAQVGNKDLADIVARRANGINSTKAYILNDYLTGKNKKQPLRHTALDSWGLCGQFLHLYGSVHNDANGTIYGYMVKAN